MISALIREFLLPLLLFLFLRSLLRSFFARSRASARRPPAAPPKTQARAGGVLQKDPVCGTYVSADSSITYTINGHVVHFCSQECCERYRAR